MIELNYYEYVKIKDIGWHNNYVISMFLTVLHLIRGQIFNIEDRSIFIFGGGLSIDKAYRTIGASGGLSKNLLKKNVLKQRKPFEDRISH